MKVEFDYTRSLGPVLSRFMSALRQRQVLGGSLSDGRVSLFWLDAPDLVHFPMVFQDHGENYSFDFL